MISTDEALTVFRVVGESELVSAYTRAAGAAGLFARSQQQGVSAGLLGAAALAGGVAGLNFFRQAAVDAGNEAETFQRAVGNLKGQMTTEELHAFTDGLRDLTGIDDDQIARVVGVLGTFSLPVQQAKDLTLPVLNATRALEALGLTSQQVANMVGKAIESGNAGALRRVGIVIDLDQFKAATTTAERTRIVIEALQRQGGDAAVQFRHTLPGAFQAFQSELHELSEEAGKLTAGPLGALTEVGISAVRAFREAPEPIKQTAFLLGGAASLAALAWGGSMVWANLQTGFAVRELVNLTRQHTQAAAAARVQMAAEAQLAGTLGGVGVAAGRAGGVPVAGIPRTGGFGGFSPAAASGVAATEAEAAEAALLAGGGTAAARGLFGLPAGATPGITLGLAGAGGLALSLLPKSGNADVDRAKDVVGATLQGAAGGGFLGSLFGPEGTLIGAGIGGVAGGAGALWANQQAEFDRAKREIEERNKPTDSETVAHLKKIIEELQKGNAAKENFRQQGPPLDTTALPGRDQAGALLDSL